VARLIEGLTVEGVRANVQRVREEIADAAARAGRSAQDVQLLAAVKYVAIGELPVLHAAGLELVGENRAQELVAKHAAPGGAQLTWDFIGHLQSRKVKQVLPLARLIHSVGSDSVVEQLARHAPPGTEVLVEVNIASEPEKSGIAPAALPAFLASIDAAENVAAVGLMTMPPYTEHAEDSRRHFAALAQLAADHGLRHLSMGTTQDFAVAVQEGATIVRVGTKLYV
jgi:pyridoxal phosphate enzyme (YggS family)